MSRYVGDVDYGENCITVTDIRGELINNFGSEIILTPIEDAEIIVNKLNFYDNLSMRLIRELTYNGYVEENIQEIIDEVKEGFMND